MCTRANLVSSACIEDMCCLTILRFYRDGVVVVVKRNRIEINAICSRQNVYFAIRNGELCVKVTR